MGDWLELAVTAAFVGAGLLLTAILHKLRFHYPTWSECVCIGGDP